MSYRYVFLREVLISDRASSRLGPPFGVLFARCPIPGVPLPTLPGGASALHASSPVEACCFVFHFNITVPISSVSSYVQIHASVSVNMLETLWLKW